MNDTKKTVGETIKGFFGAVGGVFKRIGWKSITRGQLYGATSIASVVVVLGIIVVIMVFSYNHNTQFDLTHDKRYTLSPQTEKILADLQDDLEAVVFTPTSEPEYRQAISDYLDRYKYASGGSFHYRFVDPDLNPGEVEKYKVAEYNTVVFIYGDNQERAVIDEFDLFDKGEQTLTNAILKVVNAETKSVYFLINHGEKSLENDLGNAKIMLESQNYNVADLDLLNTPEIPEDAAVLIIAGPRTDLFPVELESIEAYLNRGGALLAMIEPGSLSNYEAYLTGFGLNIGNDLIIDTSLRAFGGDYFVPMISRYVNHPITVMLVESFLSYARSVMIDDEVDSDWVLTELAMTGEQAWAETNLTSDKAEYNEGADIPGPVPVAVIGYRNVGGDESEEVDDTADGSDESEESMAPEARFAVFGDSDFIVDGLITKGGNIDLFVNTVNWLAEQDDLVAITPKSKTSTPLSLSGRQVVLMLLVSLILIPLAVLVSGVVVWLVRRWRT
ncbi:MAG: GldG family protein [Deltaproteobacteria bacterium]|nr:GldG family protein [Candidatus Zymogenaceae bacterium]